MQEGDRRAAAHAAALGELVAPESVLLGAVEVGVLRQAGLGGRLHEGVGERVVGTALGDRQRAADAVELVGAALVVLAALEVLKDLVVRPPARAARRPLVEIGAVTADVDHRVDRAAAAERLGARQVRVAAVEAGLGVGREVPVVTALEQLPERDRDVDLLGVISAAGLDEGDLDRGVLREAAGEYAAGRSGSDDDVVVDGRSPRCLGRAGGWGGGGRCREVTAQERHLVGDRLAVARALVEAKVVQWVVAHLGARGLRGGPALDLRRRDRVLRADLDEPRAHDAAGLQRRAVLRRLERRPGEDLVAPRRPDEREIGLLGAGSAHERAGARRTDDRHVVAGSPAQRAGGVLETVAGRLDERQRPGVRGDRLQRDETV